jgi:hypothetical protein
VSLQCEHWVFLIVPWLDSIGFSSSPPPEPPLGCEELGWELSDRADVLKRKLDVLGDTAQALTDIIDADRATRLEAAIVILIVLELIAAIVQIALALRGR